MFWWPKGLDGRIYLCGNSRAGKGQSLNRLYAGRAILVGRLHCPFPIYHPPLALRAFVGLIQAVLPCRNVLSVASPTAFSYWPSFYVQSDYYPVSLLTLPATSTCHPSMELAPAQPSSATDDFPKHSWSSTPRPTIVTALAAHPPSAGTADHNTFPSASLSPQSYSSPWLQSLDLTPHELVNPYIVRI